MKGVVLCGGNSTRMQTDKGLLNEGDKTWAAIAVDKLEALGLPVVISVNARQVQVYGQLFPEDRLVADNKSFDVKAPLFGLLSVHLQHPNEDLFVLACDIKDMRPDLLQALLQSYQTGHYEAIVYHTGDRPQPLCGIYNANGLHNVHRLFENGQLGRYSMMHLLEVLNTQYISARPEDLPAFNNYNSPDELTSPD